MADRAGSVPAILENHNFTDRYILYGINTGSPTAKGPRIGTCSIRSIEPGPDTGRGKIYVYAVEKEAPYQTARIGWIGETPVLNGQIINCNLEQPFDTGRTGMIPSKVSQLQEKLETNRTRWVQTLRPSCYSYVQRYPNNYNLLVEIFLA